MGFEEKRRQILDAASVMFAEKGYHQAALGEMAGRVNIRAPGLYYYFTSKEDLYNSLLMDICSKLSEAVLEPVREAPGPGEKIRLLVVGLVDFWAGNPGFPRILAREALMRSRFIDDELVPNFLVPMFGDLTGTLGDSGPSAAGFRTLDIPLLAYNVLGMTMFYFMSSRMYSTLAGEDSLSPERVSAFRQEVLSLVFHGIEQGGI